MLPRNIIDLIGIALLAKTRHLSSNPHTAMYAKLEKLHPGGSAKDRIAKYIIEQAEKNCCLNKKKT